MVDGVGAFGTSHIERGLAYVEVALSGHMYEILSSFELLNSYFNFLKGSTIFASCCIPDHAVFDGF